MEWKGCYFENCRLALGVVFCRVNPLGLLSGRNLIQETCKAGLDWDEVLFGIPAGK